MPVHVEPEERVADICRAVVDIASTRGFDAVTIRSIASELRSSTTAVTHYLPTREQLLRLAVREELLRFEVGQLEAIGDSTGFNALRTLVAYTVFDAPERSRRFWMQVVMSAQRDPLLHSELQRFNMHWDKAIRALLIEQGIAVQDLSGVADQLDIVISGSVMLSFETDSGSAKAQRPALESLLESILAPRPH